MYVDIHDELEDLLKVYKDAAEHLAKQEEYKLNTLISIMKEFIKVHEDRKMMDCKYKKLFDKTNPEKHQPVRCGNEEDEE